MRRITTVLLLVICVVAAALAVGCVHPGAAYVKADRQTFNAISPILVDVAEGKPISDEEKAALPDAVAAWKNRLESAEKSLPPSDNPKPVLP